MPIDRTNVSIHKGGIYIIRDNPEWMNGSGLERCQYAAPAKIIPGISMNSWDIEWKPCGEGSMFDEIQPFLMFSDAKAP